MKAQFVILITLAFAIGCADESLDERGPLARASVEKPTLTSSVPSTSTGSPSEATKLEPKLGSTGGANVEESAKSDSRPVQDKPDAQPDNAPEIDFDESEVLHDPEPFLEPDDGVTLTRLLTAPSVEAREPVAASTVFGHHEEKVYAFLDVQNTSTEEKTLTVFFIAPSGKVTGGVELSVPAETPRWRTWAFTRHADELGLWRVEVRSPSGALLGALPFEVAEGC